MPNNIPNPTPWYNAPSTPQGGQDTGGASQVDQAMPPQNELKSQVFSEGANTGLQDQVMQIVDIAKAIATSYYSIEITEEDLLRIAKETVKSISKAVSESAVQPIVDKIDSFLDKGKDKEKKESPQQQGKATPPWQGGQPPQQPAPPQQG